MNIQKKLSVGIICGGRSLEHSLSIVSAKSIDKYLNAKYRIVILYIDTDGNWHHANTENLQSLDSLLKASFDFAGSTVVHVCKNGKLLSNGSKLIDTVDAVFPITNGIDGYQGAIPGMMRLLDIPCVGSDIFETVVCIDKEITKSLLANNDLPVVPYLVGRKYEDNSFEDIVNKFGLPFFIKPCRLSSSAGISKVNSHTEYKKAVFHALKYDDKFLIELCIFGREIESAIIGNNTPKVSDILGEAIVNDYGAFNKSRGEFIVPADLEANIKKEILNYAKEAYVVLGCKGFARIDFFLDSKGKLYINEATTLPIFTSESMFPKVWGKEITNVVQNLVEMSFEKHNIN